MRRIGLFFLLSLCAAASFPEASPRSYSSIASGIGAIGPREENSDQETAFWRYLGRFASECGLNVSFSDFSRSRDYHSFSRIAKVGLAGRRNDTLVIAVAADGEKTAALALALSMMDALSRKSAGELSIGVEFLFLGAETGKAAGSKGYPLGSSLAIAEIPEGRPTAVIYLTMDDLSRVVRLDNAATGMVSPFWIFKDASDCLARSGFALRHSGALNLFFRSSLMEGRGPASPFLLAGIPALELGTAPNAPAGADEEALASEWISFIDGFLARNRDGFSDVWDMHYFVLDGPRGPVVIMESIFIVLILSILLSVCLVFMFSSIFARKTVIGLVNGFAKSAYSLLICFLLCLAVLYGSSLLASAAFALKGLGDSWLAFPAPYLIARAAIVVAAFAALCALFIRLKLMPVTISFYGAGSALLFFAAIFVYSAMDISFSLFFAWACAACILSMLFRNKLAGTLGYALILAPFALLASSGGAGIGGKLLKLLVTPDFGQCLVLAFIVLPLLLLFIRLVLVFHYPAPERGKRLSRWLEAACAAIIVSAAIFMLAYRPFSNARPIPLDILVERDGSGNEGRMTISAPSALSAGWVDTGDGRIALNGTPPIRVALPPEREDAYGLDSERVSFLNRKRIVISLKAPRRAAWIDFFVESGEEMRIYDSSLPFSLSADGMKAEVFVGANPVNPLRIELTVSKEFKAKATAVYYSAGDPSMGLSEGLRIESSAIRESRSILLE